MNAPAKLRAVGSVLARALRTVMAERETAADATLIAEELAKAEAQFYALDIRIKALEAGLAAANEQARDDRMKTVNLLQRIGRLEEKIGRYPGRAL